MALAKRDDLKAIRAEYENSPLSIRSLAAKYGISKSTLAARAQSEHWHRSPISSFLDGQNRAGVQDTVQAENEQVDALAIALQGLAGLAVIVKQSMDLREHKLLADALSQYFKVILAAPPQEQSRRGYLDPELIACMPESDQNEMQRILVAAEARLNEKITPLRKPV